LTESLSTLLSVVDVLEHNRRYLNQNPYCEPQLGKRGLYRALGGHSDTKTYELAMLWVLNGSDGESTLLDIAEKSGLDFRLIKETADTLRQHQLLAECTAAQ
jgi:aminopeptidase-like protein